MSAQLSYFHKDEGVMWIFRPPLGQIIDDTKVVLVGRCANNAILEFYLKAWCDEQQLVR